MPAISGALAIVLMISVPGALRAAPLGETRDLVLVAGQSNAVGFEAPASKLPSDPGDAKVMFWWKCGDPPPDAHDSASDGWTTLQAQPRGMPSAKRAGGRQYGNFRFPEGGFGPEIGVARTLVSKEAKPIAVVKVAFNGTGMTSDWDPEDLGAKGSCYRALLDETRKAVEAAERRGVRLNLRALIWVQGESDAAAKTADVYAENLGAMIRALRRDLKAPGLAVLLGVNTGFGGGKNAFLPVVIEQQKVLAAKMDRCAYVDTAGASYASAAHFDAAGTLEIGRRFAEALLAVEAKRKP
jgi:hypothetical protein